MEVFGGVPVKMINNIQIKFLLFLQSTINVKTSKYIHSFEKFRSQLQLLFKSSQDNCIVNAFVFTATYSCHYSVPVSTQQRSDLQLCRLCMAVLHIALNTIFFVTLCLGSWAWVLFHEFELVSTYLLF